MRWYLISEVPLYPSTLHKAFAFDPMTVLGGGGRFVANQESLYSIVYGRVFPQERDAWKRLVYAEGLSH